MLALLCFFFLNIYLYLYVSVVCYIECFFSIAVSCCLPMKRKNRNLEFSNQKCKQINKMKRERNEITHSKKKKKVRHDKMSGVDSFSRLYVCCCLLYFRVKWEKSTVKIGTNVNFFYSEFVFFSSKYLISVILFTFAVANACLCMFIWV